MTLGQGRFLKTWNLQHEQQQKELGKLDYIKIKHICAPINPIKKVKDKTQNGSKYLQIMWPGDWLVSRMYV